MLVIIIKKYIQVRFIDALFIRKHIIASNVDHIGQSIKCEEIKRKKLNFSV